MMNTNKANIAVLVSGGGTNLQALLDAQTGGTLQSGQITLVISSNDSAYALRRAQAAGVPTETILPKNRPQAQFEAELRQALDRYHIDLIVLAGFMIILSEAFTAAYPRRILNVHPSLIPAFCGKGFYGLRVHEAALARGVKLTGATVHFVNEIPDGGEIVLQKCVPAEPSDTPEILQRRVMEQAEWVILPQAVEQVSAQIVKEKQHECL
ncbi:MAG: phosphoribosylglycinamide formyltransferase [Eubacteriales bacterium]